MSKETIGTPPIEVVDATPDDVARLPSGAEIPEIEMVRSK